jgi:hypothetical protein
VLIASASFIRILADPAGAVGISSTLPFAWATNDEICIAGVYEVD